MIKMKNSILLPFLAILFLVSCKGNPQPENNAEKKNEPEKFIDSYFSFAETNDPKFCSDDSIVPGDCNGGDLCFRPSGKVIYTFYCMGSDTTDFFVGSYHVKDTEIECKFDSVYSYYSGCFDCDDEAAKPQSPDSGKFKKSAVFSFVLKKTDCAKYPYGFYSEMDKYHYSVYQMTNEERNRTDDLFKQISLFRRF